MMKLQRRTVAVVAVAAVSLGLAVCGVVVWRVEKAVGDSRRRAVQQRLLELKVRTLGRQPNPGFEGIIAPASYESASVFQGACLPGRTRGPVLLRDGWD